MTTMTITEALVEKKRLKDRIEKAINNLPQLYVFLQDNTLPSGFKSIEEFKEKGKAIFQSIEDLQKRYNNISIAITEANATNKVIVGNKEYTLAAAIARKSTIQLEKDLFMKLAIQKEDIIKKDLAYKQQIEKSINEKMDKFVGKDKTIADPAMVSKLRDEFMKTETFHLHKAIDFDKIVEEQYEDLNTFVSDIDVALTVKNSQITITIED